MASDRSFGNILQVGHVLLHTDILTQPFACDLAQCHGACCIEGDAGAPVTLDEIGEIEQQLDAIRPMMTPEARDVVAQQGVSYVDPEGELVTSIVAGRDCAFARRGDCCLCLLHDRHAKPISCSLYPIREKRLSPDLIGLNYHRWAICAPAIAKGRALNMPIYKFLREPLIQRFGLEWYHELEQAAEEMRQQGLL